MDRKEIEDRILDYVYNEMSQDDYKIYQEELKKYPDLSEEAREMKKLHQKVAKLEFSDISPETKMKIMIHARKNKKKEMIYFFNNFFINPLMLIAVIVLLIIIMYYIILNH
jgi:hypothetical protein